METQLGKLEKVDLREAWNHEALDFTRWLAKKENLSLLGDEIGIEINSGSVKTEAETGNFNVDILAEEENTGKKIIIENQLEATNHDHLGKIITYASGHGAEYIIWIVKEARKEHQQAVDWLNEHTDDNTNFFLIQMELWKISNSPPAPKFYVIAQPNDWAKEVKKSLETSELSDTKLIQLEFWTQFIVFVNEHNTSLKTRKPQPQHWYDMSLGSARAHISFTLNTQENSLGCAIYMNDDKELFNFLKTKKEEIEKELGIALDWAELPGKKASRIKLSKNLDIMNQDNWNDAFKWLQEWGEKFQKVFGRYIRDNN